MKSNTSTNIRVVGTSRDDILHIPAGYDITQVSVDGGGGTNTLDLSTYQPNVTPGVYVDLESPYPGSFVRDQSYVGVWGSTDTSGTLVRGTITNIQRVIGTTGNDLLFSNAYGVNVYLNGGSGNDALSVSNADSATLIGGPGSDWLQTTVAGSTLVGGTLNAQGTPNYDSSYDTFRIGIYTATILDYNSTDHLIFGNHHSLDPAFAAASWVSDGHGGSTLMVSGAPRVTLANVPLASAQSVAYGFEYVTENGTLHGGPTNDILQCANAHVDNVQIGSGSGNDLVLKFDKGMDTLNFTNDMQVSWSDTVVNGQHSLLGTFAGGSVTLTGLATSDVSALHIQGLTTPWTIDPAHHMSLWSVPTDANLI